MKIFLQIDWILLLNNLKVLVALIMFFGCIEFIYPASKDGGLKTRFINIQIFAFNALILSSVFLLLAEWIAYIKPTFSLIDFIWPTWKSHGILGGVFAIACYAIVWDFFQYWVHRIQHVNPTLWLLHRVHHADRNINASTAVRQSLGSQFLGWLFVHVPTLLLTGGYVIPYVGWLVLFNLWGCFNHTNLRIPLGFATYLISGPQWHRLHHGEDEEYHDCNYAAFFPFIDLIFGTFKLPKKDEVCQTGVLNHTASKNPLFEALSPAGSVFK